MNRRPAFLLFYRFLACLLALTLFAGCGAPAPKAAQPPAAVVTTATAAVAPTATATTPATAAPTATAKAAPTIAATPTAAPTTAAPELSPTPVQPEIHSNSPLSVQAEWQGSAGEPVFDWSPDGALLAFNAAQGATVLRMDTYQALWSRTVGGSLSFSADGRHLAIATGRAIEVHAAADGELEANLTQPPCALAQWVGFRADGQSLAAAWVDTQVDEAVFAWVDAAKGTCAAPFARVPTGPGRAISSVAISHERDYVTAVVGDQVYLWSAADGKELTRKPGQAALFDARGYLFTVRDGDKVTVYTLATLQAEQTFQLPGSRALAVGSGQSLLAVASPDGRSQQIQFYATHYSARVEGILRDLPGDTRALAFSPDGQRLLVVASTPQSKQPSHYLALGLYSGLVAQPPDQPGAVQVLRPAVTPAPLFPILYPPVNGQYQFPAPIARPDGQLADYRLKAWDEQRGVDMIQPLIQFSVDNFVYGPASSTWEFIWPQDAIRTAALEYLQRFPKSANTEAVQWRLALSNDIMGRSDSIAWVLGQIEQGLNDGSISPTGPRINAALAPFGFVLETSLYPALDPEPAEGFLCQGAVNPLLAPGLFGDGGPAQIVRIRGLWSPIGIIAALSQTAQGHYRLTPIHNSLNFDAGLCQAVMVQDLTADGAPEVWVEETWHSGSMDKRTSYIYQWRAGRFVDISGGSISSWDFPYEIKLSGSASQVKTIEFSHYDPPSGEVHFTLKWDGEQFAPQGQSSFLEKDSAGRINTERISAAMNDGQYAELARQIRAYLSDGKNTQALHAEDLAYLHFALAMSEAFQFDPGRTRIELENWFRAELAGDTHDQPYPQAARAFLAAYQRETDLYRACQAVESADETIAMRICRTDLALRELAKHVAQLDAGHLPERLEKYGVKLTRAVTFAANDDDRPDWLLIPTPPDAVSDQSKPTPLAWLLISAPDHYTAVSQALYYTAGLAPIQFKAVLLPGSRDKTFLLRVGEELRLFSIRSGAQHVDVETLAYTLHVSDYQEQSAADGYNLLVWHDGVDYDLPELLQWDAASGQFSSYDYAEYLLLKQGHARDAARLIPTILDRLKVLPDDNYLKVSQTPRLKYLLGLAYELSGDPIRAAQVYYELWNTQPTGDYGHAEQPYAILAREKLEKVK